MKKILYIDMDGVIADFDLGVKRFNSTVDTTDFANQREVVDAICEANPKIFHTLPPIDGAIDAVHELFNHYEVYFLSTPMWNVPESFTGKRVWIDKHFGKLAHKRLILTHRKDLNMGDYLIDDRLFNGVDKFTGEHIHFGQKGFETWYQVLNYLIKK